MEPNDDGKTLPSMQKRDMKKPNPGDLRLHFKQYRFLRRNPSVLLYHATPGEPWGCMVIALKVLFGVPILFRVYSVVLYFDHKT